MVDVRLVLVATAGVVFGGAYGFKKQHEQRVVMKVRLSHAGWRRGDMYIYQACLATHRLTPAPPPTHPPRPHHVLGRW